MTGENFRGEKDRKRDEFRARVLHVRRWWRRDVLMQALEAAYPTWLSAPQIAELCAAIEPRYRRNSRFVTARSLGRLHAWRTVDRIGQRIERAGSGLFRSGTGYRYRLRREAVDFL